jgi:hypothetical protein
MQTRDDCRYERLDQSDDALGLRLVVEEDPSSSPASATASPPRKIRRPRAAAEIPQAH